jgi:hypothetical protein
MIFSTLSNNSNICGSIVFGCSFGNFFLVRIGKLLKITKKSIEHYDEF